MHVAIAIWSILAAWRWGDWKNTHYHCTMLYMASMNLLYLVLTAGYPLWRVNPDFDVPQIGVMLLYTFIVFPCTVVIFLSTYPERLMHQWIHIIKWVAIYIGTEWVVGVVLGRINYYHGWHLGWSLGFVFIMFPMLRLHYKQPFTAYLVSLFIIISLLFLFDVPWLIDLDHRN